MTRHIITTDQAAKPGSMVAGQTQGALDYYTAFPAYASTARQQGEDVNAIMYADYGLDIAPYVQYGASPRATIFLTRAAKGQAFLDGRGYVTPQDVKSIGQDVLRHRLGVTFEAEAEEVTPEMLLQRIFDAVRVP